MINLGIVSNFDIINLSFLDLVSEDISYRVNLEESGFSLLYKSLSPLSVVLTGHNMDQICKVFVFISTIPVHFINSTNKVSKYYFGFFSSLFFHIILQSFKEMNHSQQLPGVMPERSINTKTSVISKDTNLRFGSVSTKTQMKQGKQSFCMIISRIEKYGVQRIISYAIYLITIDMSFS